MGTGTFTKFSRNPVLDLFILFVRLFVFFLLLFFSSFLSDRNGSKRTSWKRSDPFFLVETSERLKLIFLILKYKIFLRLAMKDRT